MPGYKGHTVGGFFGGIAYVAALGLVSTKLSSRVGHVFSNWQLMAGLFIVSMLFALWPDIDTNSKGQDIFFGVAFILDVGLIVNGYIEAAAYFGLLAMTPIIGKHRGWTHTKLAMLLVPLPIIAVTYLYRPEVSSIAILFYGAAVAGYFSHLLLDGKITRHIRIKSRQGWHG